MKDENAVKAQNTVNGAACGDCGAAGTAEDPARRYFALHGITVEIRESRCVRALRLRLAGVDPEMRVGLKLLYLGSDREAGRGRTETYAAPGNDPYVYGAVGSPFPETPDPLRSYGLTREEDGTLWTSYYSRVSLKDPELYEKGLLFTFEIPEITAEKAPEITVSCEGREILRETVRQSGVHSFRLDFRSCADGLLRYMAEIRRRQRILYGEYERVCKKYGLRSYLICGGLIGLMRDGMLLPWDDDLDVAVTREDYEKLLCAARTEWAEGSPFRLRLPDDGAVFSDFMTRLVYTEEAPKNGPDAEKPGGDGREEAGGLPLDIYILEEAAGGRVRHFLQTKEIQLLYALCLGHRPDFRAEGHREKRRGRLILSKVLAAAGRHIPLSRLLSRYAHVSERYRGKGGGAYFQSNGYYACIPMRFDKEWFGRGREVCADGFRFTVPGDGDSFLRTMYGDYRKYPGIDARKPQHFMTGNAAEGGET